MPLKLIGAGFGRTGTMSTFTALNQLGFPCYHMMEILQRKVGPSHVLFWRRVANTPPGTQHNWEDVYENYTAAVDNPTCCVWRELMDAYPEAKVLLTLHPRGAEAWYESTMKTIYRTETMWQFKLLKRVTPFGSMPRKLIWNRLHKGTMENREAAIARYNDHIEEVKAAVPPERLLVFSVDQGWQPLCDFLGVAVPNFPFPNVNDRAEIQKFLRDVSMGAYVYLAAGAAGASGLLYATYSALS